MGNVHRDMSGPLIRRLRGAKKKAGALGATRVRCLGQMSRLQRQVEPTCYTGRLGSEGVVRVAKQRND